MHRKRNNKSDSFFLIFMIKLQCVCPCCNLNLTVRFFWRLVLFGKTKLIKLNTNEFLKYYLPVTVAYLFLKEKNRTYRNEDFQKTELFWRRHIKLGYLLTSCQQQRASNPEQYGAELNTWTVRWLQWQPSSCARYF